MKVLWIVNTIFPAPSEALGLSSPVFGGWMYGLAEQVSKIEGVELAVATIYNGNEIKKITIDGIVYFLVPCKNSLKYDSNLELFWSDVCQQFVPNLVHIHGTEFTHGLACMRKLPQLKYIVSIQGLVSIISRYFYAGISFWEIFKNITFRDIVRLDTIFQQKKKFHKRGKFEREYILKTQHVIGRTNWDLAHTKTINPQRNYHFCNDILRSGFYTTSKWSLYNCNQHTVFLSQAGYPIKGLHQVIKAVFILKKDFPNLKIRVGGINITKRDTLIDRIKLSGYGKYVRQLIERYNLKDDVVFLGFLSEEQMITEYQKAHVFISPSSIENGGNSLGEAQLLGTPVVASYVGGIPDSIENEISGLLYRFEEVEMLAENIRRIFNDDDFTQKLSVNGIETAKLRHRRDINLDNTIEIYKRIIKEN